jgi:hypothetical protein
MVTHALSGLITFKYTPTLDLKSEDFALTSFGGVVSRLSRGGKFYAKNTSSLIFGNLSGYTQWLAGEDAISLSKLLRFSQYFKNRVSRH